MSVARIIAFLALFLGVTAAAYFLLFDTRWKGSAKKDEVATRTYVFSTTSRMGGKIEGQKGEVRAGAEFQYTLRQKANTIDIVMDRQTLRMPDDEGNMTVRTVTAEKLIVEEAGKQPVETLRTNVSASSREARFMGLFGKPVCRIIVDGNGHESSRTFLDENMEAFQKKVDWISLCRTFHVEFRRDQDRWTVAQVIKSANGEANGDLTYEKEAADGDHVPVRCSGKLKYKPIESRGGRFSGTGELLGTLTYDTKLGDWVSGTTLMKLALKTDDGDTMNGTIKSTLRLKTEVEP